MCVCVCVWEGVAVEVRAECGGAVGERESSGTPEARKSEVIFFFLQQRKFLLTFVCLRFKFIRTN